jgi:hypothetical protein
MRKFRDARIFNGKTGTIAHLDLINDIICFRVDIQIVEFEGDVMSGTGVEIPVEILELRRGSNVGYKISDMCRHFIDSNVAH